MTVRIAAGALEVELAPEVGGSLASLRWQGREVMRPFSTADQAAGNVLGVACFPMLPYANRIASNAFVFEGRSFRFEANNPPERYNVHGTGWQRPWRVEEASASTAHLALEVNETPYAYRAEQRFALDGGALTVAL